MKSPSLHYLGMKRHLKISLSRGHGWACQCPLRQIKTSQYWGSSATTWPTVHVGDIWPLSYHPVGIGVGNLCNEVALPLLRVINCLISSQWHENGDMPTHWLTSREKSNLRSFHISWLNTYQEKNLMRTQGEIHTAYQDPVRGMVTNFSSDTM